MLFLFDAQFEEHLLRLLRARHRRQVDVRDPDQLVQGKDPRHREVDPAKTRVIACSDTSSAAAASAQVSFLRLRTRRGA